MINLHIGLVTRNQDPQIQIISLTENQNLTKKATVTGNIKEEENVAKNATDDADENAEENEKIHEDKEKVVTI